MSISTTPILEADVLEEAKPSIVAVLSLRDVTRTQEVALRILREGAFSGEAFDLFISRFERTTVPLVASFVDGFSGEKETPVTLVIQKAAVLANSMAVVAYTRLNQPDTATRLFELSLRWATEIDWISHANKAINNLAALYKQGRFYEKAVDLFTQYLTKLRELGLSGRMATSEAVFLYGSVCSNLGETYRAMVLEQQDADSRRDLLNTALEYHLSSLEARESLGDTKFDDKVTVLESLSNLGVTYLDMGDVSKSLEILKRAFDLNEEIKSDSFDVEVLSRYTRALVSSKNFARAKSVFGRLRQVYFVKQKTDELEPDDAQEFTLAEAAMEI